MAIYLDDLDNPQWPWGIPNASAPTQWVDQGSVPISSVALDNGLGVKYYNLYTAGGTYLGQYVDPCTGARTSPCPRTGNPATDTRSITNWSAASLPEGPVTLKVRAFDALVHPTATDASVIVRVDHSNPDLSLGGGLYDRRGQTVGAGQIELTADASDSRSGINRITVSVDSVVRASTTSQLCPGGGCDQDFSWTLDGTQFAEGSHSVSVTASDQVNRTVTQSFNVIVDKTAPDTTITQGPSGTLSTAETTLTFQSPDTAATFQCSLDGVGWNGCSSPAALESLPDGGHTMAVRAVDAAGNADPSPATSSFSVNNQNPETVITAGPDPASPSPTGSFAFSGNSFAAGFECRIDGNAWLGCQSPKTYTGAASGEHLFEARALSASGQPDPTPANKTWTVDTTGPSLTLGGSLYDTSTTGGTTLFVEAVDGSIDDSSDSLTTSAVGVRDLELRLYPNAADIDSEDPSKYQVLYSDPPCTSGPSACPSTVDREIEVPFAGVAQGTHGYMLVAHDAAGSPSSRSWTRTSSSATPAGHASLGYAPTDRFVGPPYEEAVAHNNGADWVYLTPQWGQSQPQEFTPGGQPTTADVSNIAQAVEAAHNAGDRVVLAVSGTPVWARDDDPTYCTEAKTDLPDGASDSAIGFCAPELSAIDKWATYVLRAVATLHPGDAVQIWNEPNNAGFSGGSRQYNISDRRTFYQGMPPGVYYGSIFKPALEKLQSCSSQAPPASCNANVPQVTVLAGGLASAGYRVDRSMDKDNGRPYKGNNYSVYLDRFLDATQADGLTGFKVAQHIYPYPPTSFKNAEPTSLRAASGDMALIYQKAQMAVNRHSSASGAVWVTETGLSTKNLPYQYLDKKGYKYTPAVERDALLHMFCRVVPSAVPMLVFKLIDDTDHIPPQSDMAGYAIYKQNAGFGTLTGDQDSNPAVFAKKVDEGSDRTGVSDALKNAAASQGGC